jgi:hypothetical protein
VMLCGPNEPHYVWVGEELIKLGNEMRQLQGIGTR